jgi:colanic acid/amylovoran biosynthesis glycosyltransferase
VRAVAREHPVAFSVVRDAPRAEVLAAMERAHLLLHPSRVGPDGDKEGIPNVVKEAMAAGLPVVATRHGGLAECVAHEESGLLADEGDAEGLRAQLARLIAHPGRWAAMGRRGRAIVEARYALGVLVPRLLAEYDALIETRRMEGTP